MKITSVPRSKFISGGVFVLTKSATERAHIYYVVVDRATRSISVAVSVLRDHAATAGNFWRGSHAL